MKQGNKINLTKRQSYWLAHIESSQAANQAIATYAKEKGLRAKSMYAAKKKLISLGALPVEATKRFHRTKAASPVPYSALVIQCPNGLSIVVSGSTDRAALTTVLQTVVAQT